MISFLIALIYMSFISLGLGQPEPLLGSAWPVMQTQMGSPLSYAGIVFMLIAGCTIISSLLSDRLVKRFGTGLITAVSAVLTALALFGFSMSSAFWMLCFWAIPYGFSAGAIDAALNNYVALHFASRHMNWLHAFWGVGAATGPYIMSFFLTRGMDWNNGYRTVSIIQISLAVLLFVSLPLWKKPQTGHTPGDAPPAALSLPQILRIRGVKYVLIAFFGYCALESTTGLWSASYLVSVRGIGSELAAKYASFFFIGITAGRFISGFISNKLGNFTMIRLGIGLIVAGLTAILLPVSADWLCLNGLIVVGLGCAPIYPSIIHATPDNFGKENSQAIVGVQMASAYTGATLMPPLFGFIANRFGLHLFPLFLLFFVLLMFFLIEALKRTVRVV
ncbi:MAG: MFS transporter [Oscillospiraceae bacterium]|nr:MFS transporter [Oscillospiraceae bacterium]